MGKALKRLEETEKRAERAEKMAAEAKAAAKNLHQNEGVDGQKCHYCGETGHRVKQCPKKKADKAAEKAKKGAGSHGEGEADSD